MNQTQSVAFSLFCCRLSCTEIIAAFQKVKSVPYFFVSLVIKCKVPQAVPVSLIYRFQRKKPL